MCTLKNIYKVLVFIAAISLMACASEDENRQDSNYQPVTDKPQSYEAILKENQNIFIAQCIPKDEFDQLDQRGVVFAILGVEEKLASLDGYTGELKSNKRSHLGGCALIGVDGELIDGISIGIYYQRHKPSDEKIEEETRELKEFNEMQEKIRKLIE